MGLIACARPWIWLRRSDLFKLNVVNASGEPGC